MKVAIRWVSFAALSLMSALALPALAAGGYYVSNAAFNGAPQYLGDGGSAQAASAYTTGAVAVDAAGNIYVTDPQSYVVRKINTAGIVTTFAGNGTSGFSGDGGAATAAQLTQPNGIAVDALGNVYFSDGITRVRKVDINGTITTFAGNGTQGPFTSGVAANTTAVNFPGPIAVDGNNNVYIGQSGAVRMVNTSGNITNFATLAFTPVGMALDNSGAIYVTDGNSGVYKITAAAGPILFAGSATSGSTFGGDGGAPLSAQFYGLQGVAVDANSNIFLVDHYNYRVRMISGGIVSTVSGNGSAGSAGGLPNGVLGTTAGTSFVMTGAFAAPNGDIYYCDSGRVRRLSLTNVTTLTNTTLALAGGVVGTPYNAALAATGSAPITWSFSFGTLPPGLTLTPTGGLSGTPTAAGAYSFTLQSWNGGPSSAPQAYTMQISASPTAHANFSPNTPTSFPNSQAVGTSSSPATVLLYNDGSAPFTWTNMTSTSADFQITYGPNCPAIGASFPAGAACTISIVFTPTATGNRFGQFNLVSTPPQSSQFINVSGFATGVPLVPAVSFAPNVVTVGFTSTLTVTITNNNAVTATGVGFNFGYPANLLNALPSNATTTCGIAAGSLTATPNTGGFAANNLTVPANSSCTVKADVIPGVAGNFQVTVAVSGLQSQNLGSNVATAQASVVANAPNGPVFSSNPAANVVFGNQNVNSPSTPQQVTVTNTGNTAMNISAIATTNSDYAITHNCPIAVAALGAGGTCTVTVTFTPTHVGIDNGVLTFTTNAAGSPQGLSLFGNGTGVVPAPTAALSFVPSTIGINGTGALTLTLSSTLAGTTNIVSGSMAIPSGFGAVPNTTVTGTCGSSGGVSAGSFQFVQGTIPANGSCTIVVQLLGVTVGNYNLTFAAGALTSSSGSNTAAASTPANVSLSAGVTFNPTPLNFGSQGIGTTSAAQRSVLKNNGTSPLAITSISALGDFGFVSDCPLTGIGVAGVTQAPATLAAGGTCNIDVTFSPLSPGLQNTFVYVNDNAPGGPHALPVSGQGVQISLPGISVTPRALPFDDRVIGSVSPLQAITVTNTGQGNLNLSGVVVAGASFTRVTANPAASDCGAVVAPQASCLIAIVFAPNTVGANTGSVTITHNAAGSSFVVSLSGNGTPVPQPLIRMVESLAFGDQIIGTASAARTLTFTNFGTAPLSLSSVQIAGANAADFNLSGSCANAIAPNANCSVTVTFKPAVVGAKTAEVDVVSNAQNAATVNKVSLSGNGVPVPKPVVRVSATAIGFGNVLYGGTPGVRGVTLSNVGTGPLLIQQIAVSGNSDFTQSLDCGSSIAPQGQCTIAVKFTPHALGQRSAVLNIFTNADGSPHQVQLSGAGCHYYSPTASRLFLSGC